MANGIKSVMPTFITPEMAKEFLSKNPGNRKMSKSTVDNYARDMVAGRWSANGVPIVLDPDGNLRDGQHRCAAAVKSGCGFYTVIVVTDDFGGIDIGKKRKSPDIARINCTVPERVNCNRTFAAAKYLIRFERGINATQAEAEEFLRLHECAVYFANSRLQMKRGLTAAVLAAIVAAYESDYPPALLARFCEVLGTGIAEEKREKPIVMLRNNLIEQDREHGGSRQKRDYLLTQRALVAYHKSEPLSRLLPLKAPVYKTDDKEENDGA